MVDTKGPDPQGLLDKECHRMFQTSSVYDSILWMSPNHQNPNNLWPDALLPWDQWRLAIVPPLRNAIEIQNSL